MLWHNSKNWAVTALMTVYLSAVSDLSTAISRKCKIGGKLVLITNRKSYMSFRLVPKSVTLNNLEPRNGVILRYLSEFR